MKDVSMIRKKVSSSILRNCFKALLNKLGQIWDFYVGYKCMDLQENEVTRKLIEEKEELVDDKDIQEVDQFLSVHNKYTNEIKEMFELFKHLVIEHYVPS